MRGAWVGAALVVMLAGLTVHRLGSALPPTARDVTADALWAAMLFCLVSCVRPRAAVMHRALFTLLVCVAVETSQRVRTPWLVQLRATTLGHLVLGSDFDARDLLAYAGGVVAAAGAATAWERHRRA